MKPAVIIVIALCTSAPLLAAPAPQSSRVEDANAVEAVLARYQQAIERLDLRDTADLFAADSEIVESASLEGTYANYLAHHLTPEIGEFKSFVFSDYKVSVRFEGPVALATETYRYRIEPKTGSPAERLGAASSVLRKESGRWKIISMHSSARRPPNP
ncbi:SgcJ/EcaC family oxidoreductase [Sphingomonas sp. ID1715]|uniref:YybH family protein n=1 Tax=Sphingomonas sp. ID1715 TaxID=1656898 RepID=UPI001487EEA7|nr:SgcJ/EcaC family oxidoreductase [Sphingomonas sp. ID1715]NNM77781.1 SgcJ/EcaC family oxidoreductase [Sphingomonas sp. ID1715]